MGYVDHVQVKAKIDLLPVPAGIELRVDGEHHGVVSRHLGRDG